MILSPWYMKNLCQMTSVFNDVFSVPVRQVSYIAADTLNLFIQHKVRSTTFYSRDFVYIIHEALSEYEYAIGV